MIGIYKITNLLNGKVYIGQSVDIQKRLKAHFAYAKNKNSKEYNTSIHNAIRLYGDYNFKCEVLQKCTKEQLDELEKYYINLYDSTNRQKGYNLTQGGFGGHKTRCRHILQYDLSGNLIKEWNSIWEASEELNIPNGSITACCYGQKSAYGFQWKFSDDTNRKIEKYFRNYYNKGLELGRKPVQVIGTNEEGIEYKFDMIIEAAKWLVKNHYSKAKNLESIRNRISSVKNTGKKAYGFIWKTKESD